MRIGRGVCLVVASAGLVACGSDNSSNGASQPPGPISSAKQDFVIGSLLAEQNGIKSMDLAIEDINAAGVLPVRLVGIHQAFGDNDDRTVLAKNMFDKQNVKALTSSWSSTGLKVLRLTNTDAYKNIVQCSDGSSNTTINDPNTPNDAQGQLMSDKNDSYYRAVSNDKKQAVVVFQRLTAQDKAGIYWSDEPYGQTFEKEVKKNADAAGKTLVFDKSYASMNFSTAGAKADLDDLLAKNASGQLTSLVLVGLVGDAAGAIVDYLVSAATPFQGQIIVPDGLADNSLFASQKAAFATWLAKPGNSLTATLQEGMSGANSKTWADRFKARFPGEDPTAAYTTTMYDCVYSFAVAMMYGKGTVGPTTLHDGMLNLKKSQLGDAPVSVAPTVEGLKAAQAAIAAGKKVLIDGASGLMRFDNDGDAIDTLYAVLKISGTAGAYKWAPNLVWDPNNNKCFSGCQ